MIGILLELGNAAYSWNNGLAARGHDPWRGTTLEWFALSPPPPHNFDAVPDVRSGEPLHDIRESIAIREGAFRAPAPLDRPSAPEPEREPEPAPAADATAAESAPTATAVAEPEAETEQGSDQPEESPDDSDDGDSPPVA